MMPSMTTGEHDHADTADWPLGPVLTAAREERGLSLREAAAAAGFSKDTWSALEKGYRGNGARRSDARKPDARNVIAAARVVGLNINEALRLSGNPIPEPIPTGRPTTSVTSLARKIGTLPADLQQAIETIVDSHLRATGHLPATSPAEFSGTGTGGTRHGLPTSLGETALTGPEYESAPESAGDRGQSS
jgi:transcriptional regulator with XRE-family HTH domain